MKQVFKSRVVVSTLLAALLFTRLSLGVGAPTLAENEALPAPAEYPVETISSSEDKPFVPPELLKNEVESMNSYTTLLLEYRKQFDTVTESKNPDSKQIAALESKIRDLRSQIPKRQIDAGAAVTKLKNAGKYSKELDDYFEANAGKRGVPREYVEFVKKNGGARSAIDKGLASLARLSVAFDEDGEVLAELKSKKVGWLQQLESLVVQSAHAKLSKAGDCYWMAAVLVISSIPTLGLAALIGSGGLYSVCSQP